MVTLRAADMPWCSVPPVIAIVGPTGTGKSGAAVLVAQALYRHSIEAEIINSDAMQFYRGMDIGTAKISVAEQGNVIHHMIDIMDVTEEASVALFQKDARDLIAHMQKRHCVPIIVGGSGLYNRAVLDVLEFPPTDHRVRERIEGDALKEAAGVVAQAAQILQRQLEKVDPAAAARQLDFRRLVRALEVYHISGRPFSAYMPQRVYYQPAFQYGLRMDRKILHQRLADRVVGMVERGLLSETQVLERKGLRLGKTASQAVGYSQMLQVVDHVITVEEAVEKTIAATRKLARRQETWFGADPRVRWFDPLANNYAEMLIQQVFTDLNLG